jgi:hypothetical protein
MSDYIENTEIPQINDPFLHLYLLEKQKQDKPKTSRRSKNKNKCKINKKEIKKSIQRVHETKVVSSKR